MSDHIDQVDTTEQEDMRFYIETLDGVSTSEMTDAQVLDYIDQNASSGSMAYTPQAER